MRKNFLKSVITVVLIGVAFYGGFLYGRNQRPSVEKVQGVFNQETSKPENVDFSLFWDAWARVQERYVGRSALDYQKMVFGAISGMVKAIGDPYTVFMPPEDSKKFSEDIKGSFEGVGMEIGIRKEVLTIIAPLENSPAKRAGLMAGDKILKIDDNMTSDLTLDEAVSKIRGPKGSQVALLVSRDSWDEAKEFKITRDVIEVPVISYELKNTGSKQIAYIRLYQFSENAGTEFKKIADQILNSSAQGILLDLRGNPGGYLEISVDIASWFLKSGELVVAEDYGNGEKNENKSYGYNKLGHYPLVILIDQGSASASEILAGALRDNRGVKLVGEKSFGKGSVQKLEDLPGGSSLKITVAKWLTPSGHSIADAGLEPDEKVEITEKDIEAGKDPQLDKALEMISR
ncbi:MAG: S41 family peptidase [Candidatus Portnoybacteria bacterium]|nr:S41 family peptidase [Candidatus Portnoybacteria bacterium]